MEGDWQIIAIELGLTAPEPMALVVPLPIVVGDGDAVRFIDLEPGFFGQLQGLFGEEHEPPPPVPVSPLEREFIGSMSDLGKLDPNYQLPSAVWPKVGEYWDYGFAVFRIEAGTHTSLSVALRFRTRARAALFFPTVFAREAVPATTEQPHELYMQTVDAFALGTTNTSLEFTQASDEFEDEKTEEVELDEERSLPTSPPAGAAGFVPPGWRASEAEPSFALVDSGLVVGGYAVARTDLIGERTNVDTWIRL